MSCFPALYWHSLMPVPLDKIPFIVCAEEGRTARLELMCAGFPHNHFQQARVYRNAVP